VKLIEAVCTGQLNASMQPLIIKQLCGGIRQEISHGKKNNKKIKNLFLHLKKCKVYFRRTLLIYVRFTYPMKITKEL
jgi:hypothetical protein